MKFLGIDSIVSHDVAESISEEIGGQMQISHAVLILEGFDSSGEPFLTFVTDDSAGIWTHIGMMKVVEQDMMLACQEEDE